MRLGRWPDAPHSPPVAADRNVKNSCRPPRKSSRPLESLQKTRYATSRNPRNGAAILAVPRLNLSALRMSEKGSPHWTKIKHPNYSQAEGREELFERERVASSVT